MICLKCKQRDHTNCRGGTWCDCQHRPVPKAPPVAESVAVDANSEKNAGDSKRDPEDSGEEASRTLDENL